MQICADGPSRKAWTCYLGVMIILQHERRGGCCWTTPFIYSTASSRFIGIVTTEKVGAHILTHNFIRCSHTSSLFFCISGQGQSRYSYSLIHMLNNCSNVINFRERQQQHKILLLPFTVDKWSKRDRNYIIKSYLNILWMQSHSFPVFG